MKIDESSQEIFTAQRDLYFPKHLNYLDAHVTLFHKLPSDDDQIRDILESLSKRVCFDMNITGLKNIGGGVAYIIDSPGLMQIHKEMQIRFSHILIGKDKQELWPHITVQNKVTAQKANVLYKLLCESFIPFTVTAIGFSTWLYLQGPWEKKSDYLFQKS